MVARRASGRRGSRHSLAGLVENHQDANSNPYVSVSVRSLDGDSWSWEGLRVLRDWLICRIERWCPGSTRWILVALAMVAIIVAMLVCTLLDLLHLYSQFCSIAVPFFAMICGYLLLALGFRHTWTSTGIYLTFCGSVVGETVGFFLSSALLNQGQDGYIYEESTEGREGPVNVKENRQASVSLLHPLYLVGYSASLAASTRLATASRSHSSFIVLAVLLLRSVGCISLPSLSTPLRPIATYLAGLIGILAAKYTESSMMQPPVISLIKNTPHLRSLNRHRLSIPDGAMDAASNSDPRVLPARRRRTSSAALTSTSLQVSHCSTSPGSGQALSPGAGQGPPKARRTSLPALLANKNHYHSSMQNFPTYGLDVALLSEAHGLVTDLLLETSNMSPHLASGLKALANLLSPPLPTHGYSTHGGNRSRHVPAPHAALSDIQCSSDTEEIPYTGEPLSLHSKRGKRFVPPNLLRRMSTSTWTTTTSATGLPTIEPEPCRKRTASFRNPTEVPSISPNQSHASLQGLLVAAEGGGINSNQQAATSTSGKSRSHSTTSLYGLHPHGKRLMRERKTVCSLHPLTANETSGNASSDCHSDSEPRADDSEPDQSITAPGSAQNSRRGSGISTRRSSGAGSTGSRRGSTVTTLPLMPDRGSRAGSVNEGSESGDAPIELHPIRSASPVPAIGSVANRPVAGGSDCNGRCTGRSWQAAICPTEDEGIDHESSHRPQRTGKPWTSDYGSSDSPSSSDHCDDQVPSHPSRSVDPSFNINHSITLGQPIEKTQHGTENEAVDQVEEEIRDRDEPENCVLDSAQNGERLVSLSDGSLYSLDHLDNDPLLNNLKEWDYPIFDLLHQYGEHILSATCYRVFLEVGLLETFKIPIHEFFNFFHALEMGYREKPYHNRTHASDVLHAVYYLTSQPIPGFQVLPAETETSPFSSGSSEQSSATSPALTQRASFNYEDSYGIMGANFPALELMALYTAAAMHDYDHPGRTNAFLVSTLAPQAILYNDRSVLENHHLAAAWSLFLSDDRFNFLIHLERSEFRRFRYLIIEAILATDLKRHFEILAEFNAKVNDADGPGIDWTNESDRLLAMQMCIKLADINGPCKTHSIHVQWTERIAEEFYEQGDEEAALGMPISPYMDRNNPQLAKLQESFINHLVAPLCNAYGEAGLLPGVWEDEATEDEMEDEFPMTINPIRIELETVDTDEGEDTGEQSQSDCDFDQLMASPCSDLSASDSDTPVRSKSSPIPSSPSPSASRKIVCLQTRHLQENHRYWVAQIKESELRANLAADPGPLGRAGVDSPATPAAAASGASANAEGPSRDSTPLSPNPNEERMEPIEEENSPKSFDRTFSFEREDSRL